MSSLECLSLIYIGKTFLSKQLLKYEYGHQFSSHTRAPVNRCRRPPKNDANLYVHTFLLSFHVRGESGMFYTCLLVAWLLAWPPSSSNVQTRRDLNTERFRLLILSQIRRGGMQMIWRTSNVHILHQIEYVTTE